MKKIKLYTLLLGMMMGATSCLDKYPEDMILANKAINTIEEADQAVMGIYSSFLSPALYSGYLTLVPDLQADLAYAVNGYTNTYGDIWRWNILSTSSEIESIYAALYDVIGRSNFLLANVDKVKANIIKDSDMDRLDAFCGEAYFARALAYSELVKLYCNSYENEAQASNDLGVVIRTQYYGNEPIVRSSLEDSYKQILSDLNKAEELLTLDEESMEANSGSFYNTTYFNQFTVYALRSRLALYMNDYDSAIEYSSKLIDSGEFMLSSCTEEYTSGTSYYRYMWTTDNSTEVIWKIGFTSTNYGGAIGSVFFNYDYRSYKPDYVPAQWVLDLYASGDLRYNDFFVTQPTGYSHGLTWPLLAKYWGNTNLYNEAQLLQMSMPKVFRLSEQYLIRAEAYAQNGDYNKAAKDITSLRAARYENYGGGTSLNADNAMTVIEEERVKELYMEGFRLTDLKRWKKGFERTPQTESLENGSSLKIEANNPLFVWPIPQHELEAPGANILPNASNK